jgi:hypothetical protein
VKQPKRKGQEGPYLFLFLIIYIMNEERIFKY